jgi:hypothetical protein
MNLEEALMALKDMEESIVEILLAVKKNEPQFPVYNELRTSVAFVLSLACTIDDELLPHIKEHNEINQSGAGIEGDEHG